MAVRGQTLGKARANHGQRIKNKRTIRKERKHKKAEPMEQFSIPSLDEVKAYTAEHNYITDPIEFFRKCTKQHWKQNGNRIKDWKALLDSWELIEKKKQRQTARKEADRPEYMSRVQETVDQQDDPQEVAALIANIERLKAEVQRQIDEYQASQRRTE